MEKLKKILILLKEEMLQEDNSMLPMLIIINTLVYEYKNEELNLKKLYLELPYYSGVSIKKHLRKLSSNDFIALTTSVTDARSKSITSKQRLKILENKIQEIMSVNE